jgi:hypothetical protein
VIRGGRFAAALLAGTALHCGSPETPLPDEPRRALLPAPAGPFAPARLKTRGPVSGAVLADVESCGRCHPDALAQWRTSAHAFASFNNPVYRISIDRFRREVGRPQSQFCGGCHDVALLVDGAMNEEIAPDDPRAHAGITCRTCHSIAQASPEGNASYTLDGSEIPFPKPGDPESVLRHRERVAMPPLRTAALCASCHRAFLDGSTGNAHFFDGMNDVTAWRQSPYAESHARRIDEGVPRRDCRGCHMRREEAVRGDAAASGGRIASHRFLGGHTWLAAMRGDRDQLRRAREFLRGKVTLGIAGVTRAADALSFDVVAFNEGVGHRFPGGVLDAQDTWMEVTVRDGRGRILASAGELHERTGEDPGAHRLAALVLDENGVPRRERETHRFRTAAWNHTLLPRDARAVRYRWTLPAQSLGALFLEARLRHRTRGFPLQRTACDHMRTPRGRRFAAFRRALDPCAPQPVTEVAVARATSEDRAKGARALYRHGLALSHSLQEHLDEARPSLVAALDLARARGDMSLAAMAAEALARVAAQQGRLAEALGWLEATGAPDHPAVAFGTFQAFAQVWRWPEAVLPIRDAAAAAPQDAEAQASLAQALGSAGDFAGSLRAAQEGLRHEPRSEPLLRAQALALRALGAARDVAAAERAYLAHREPDNAPAIRAACSARVRGCSRERNPVHVHEMRSPLSASTSNPSR